MKDNSVEKSVLEDVDDAFDDVRELLERGRNRVQLGSINIAKDYIQNKLGLALKLHSRSNGSDFNLFVHGTPKASEHDLPSESVSPLYRIVRALPTMLAADHGGHYDQQDLVFLGTVESMEPPKNVVSPFGVPSFVWLDLMENLGEFRKPVLYFSLTERCFKFIPCFLYREPCALDDHNVLFRGGSGYQLIQGGSEVVQDLTADNSNLGGRLLSKTGLDECCPVRLFLFDNFIGVSAKEGFDERAALLDVCIGPFNL